MTKVLINEPITKEEAREAIRNSDISDDSVMDLISAARGAAENYVGMDIAEYTITAADGVVSSSGYAPTDVPREIKVALYWYIVNQFEMVSATDWISAFYAMLYPWKNLGGDSV